MHSMMKKKIDRFVNTLYPGDTFDEIIFDLYLIDRYNNTPMMLNNITNGPILINTGATEKKDVFKEGLTLGSVVK
jgi:hypothetical protein